MGMAQTYAESVGAKGLSGTSTKIFNDGKTLDRIASGGDIVTGSFERALQWFSDNWPAKAPWPEDVARPTPKAKKAA